MTVLISKPAINLRGELASLKKPSGIVGESILRADTAAEAVEQLDLEDHTFTTFTSTGIDDNATSTKLTVSATGIDVTGTVTATEFNIAEFSTSTNVLQSNTGGTGARLRASVSSPPFPTFAFSDDNNTGIFRPAADTLGFSTGGAERMRIDSSGNVLVGTTAVPTDDNVALGFGVTSSGEVRASVNGANAAMFKRATSDGDIVEFRKDSIKVGSIGYSSSNGFYMHTPFGNDSGLVFGSERIVPCTSSGAFDDAVVDLGYSSGRFKDLYLSGGVYLGGTGAANHLDDYEEGTWTPTALNYDGTMTVTSATYVKVGKLVTVKANVSFDATADGSGVNISGLPFTTTGTAKANGGFVTSSTVSSAARVQAVGTSSLFLTATDNSNVTYTTMSSTTLEFIMIYEAA